MNLEIISGGISDFTFLITIFTLACFIGFYVVWSVTPALYAPLMSITNAISGIIIVGAIVAAGSSIFGFSAIMGATALFLASLNIAGGFFVTRRMLSMFIRKNKKK